MNIKKHWRNFIDNMEYHFCGGPPGLGTLFLGLVVMATILLLIFGLTNLIKN